MNLLKKYFLIFSCMFMAIAFCQEEPSSLENEEYQEIVIDNPEELNGNSSDKKSSKKEKKIELAGVSEVPPAKKPKAPDAEKVRLAADKDKDDESDKTTREAIKYGIENELSDLVKKLIDNDDPRYSNELYDLFQTAKSPAIREKILEYFEKQEDPCLEDYAVTILNDPYEEKNSTVERVFRYVAAVKTKAAVPAVVKLLESENESYFTPALTTLGEIGGELEAEYLVEFLDRSDLTTPQRQQLMRVLGKIQAVQTWESLVEIAQDDAENAFVRAYAAEAIGAMKKEESIPVLIKLYESPDPNLRCYVIKGIANFNTKEARELVIQAIKDSQYKVRLDAIEAAEKMKLDDAIPYIIYRAKNDPDNQVKNKSYEILSKYGSGEAEKFLIEQITDKKTSDTVKGKVAEMLLKNSKVGRSEIAELAKNVATDDKRKPFRNTIGKLIVKYPDSSFLDVCKEYLSSKDTATCALGLDMYNTGKFGSLESVVRAIADDDRAANTNQKKAKKILKIE